jgi:hypothetical protein
VSAELVISIVSVAIAFGAVVLNFALSHRAAVRARKPVLVFVFDTEERHEGEWVLRNVGNGPALNVLVAMRAEGEWFNPVRVPPLARDSSFALPWTARTGSAGLGASYGDFEGRRYTSTLGGEIARAYDGDRLPALDDEEVVRYWQVESTIGQGILTWGAKPCDFRA